MCKSERDPARTPSGQGCGGPEFGPEAYCLEDRIHLPGMRQGRDDDGVELTIERFAGPVHCVAETALCDEGAVMSGGLAFGGILPAVQVTKELANRGLATRFVQARATQAASFHINQSKAPQSDHGLTDMVIRSTHGVGNSLRCQQRTLRGGRQHHNGAEAHICERVDFHGISLRSQV